MMGAVTAFAIMDALIKWLATDFPTMQIILFRSLFALVPIGVIIAQTGGLKTLKTSRLGSHIWRAAFWITSLIGFIYAFGRMPLTDVTAIIFASPIVVVALSGPLLREHVDLKRWLAIVAGFVGVLVVVRPSGDVLNPAAVIALGATLCYAIGVVTLRHLTTSESTAALAFYLSIVSTLVGLAAIPFGWVWPKPSDWLLLIAVGIVGGIGQLLVISAYRLAPATLIAPLDYVTILYSVILGYVLFNEISNPNVFYGAFIIVVSGLYLIYAASSRDPKS
jgi:drug/metabolite transporter (DMT)-like permease